jgi:two-component system chemotaxis response regulator CheB
MLIERDRIQLDGGPKVRHARPAADPLFVSASAAYGKRVIGVVLSGADSDGADGLRAIKAQGGMAFVQRPDEATIPSMPLAAIAADHPDHSLPAHEIAQRVRTFCS